MSKAEKNAETEGEKRQDERSKRKEGRHHDSSGATIKHAGSMVQKGYSPEEGQDRRRTALNKAVHHYGYAETVEKINELTLMNKNHKENHRRLLDDLEYLKSQFKDR
ncbi:MAG: hypothetical protein OK474_06755 [Thaumarchaeota archaeon]|nr:hypothetical protein [Nitrososphaerota archaeon]